MNPSKPLYSNGLSFIEYGWCIYDLIGSSQKLSILSIFRIIKLSFSHEFYCGWFSVWIGGSILASPGAFQQMWFSKAEYDFCFICFYLWESRKVQVHVSFLITISFFSYCHNRYQEHGVSYIQRKWPWGCSNEV